MRVLVTGSRFWRLRFMIREDLEKLPSGTTIVHGDAPGADTIAGDIAKELGFTVEAHPADWKKHGCSAGPIRNAEMAALGCDEAYAYLMRDLPNVGTRDMLHRLSVPVHMRYDRP